MKFRRYLLPFFILLFFMAGYQKSVAQSCPSNSSPNFTGGGTVFGFTPAQWKVFFSSKVDALGATLCNPTITGTLNLLAAVVSGGIFNNSTLNNPVINNPTITGLSPFVQTVTVLNGTGSLSCATSGVNQWIPTSPAPASCTTPLSPLIGQTISYQNNSSSTVYAMTVNMTSSQKVQLPGGNSSFVLLGPPGSTLTIQYVAPNQWNVI
jgi:hypothetical protein